MNADPARIAPALAGLSEADAEPGPARRRQVPDWLLALLLPAALALAWEWAVRSGHVSGRLMPPSRLVLSAAALAGRPRLLLLDKPFSALDPFTRTSLHGLLLDLWQEGRPTILLVTHDVEEAVLLADRVIVMPPRPGRGQVQRQPAPRHAGACDGIPISPPPWVSRSCPAPRPRRPSRERGAGCGAAGAAPAPPAFALRRRRRAWRRPAAGRADRRQ